MRYKVEIYNYERKIANALKRIEGSNVSDEDKQLLLEFHEECTVKGLSKARISKYFDVLGRIVVWLGKPLQRARNNWICNSSWRGAFEHALYNDTYCSDGEFREFPWFDDDGNLLPTFINNTEVPDFPRNTLNLMRWLKCDINYDGIVDMYDIGIVASAYMSGPGSSNWNRQADVTNDWTVDMFDLGRVAAHFGEST